MRIFVRLLFVIAVCAAGVIEDISWEDQAFEARFDTEGAIDQDFIDNYKDSDNGFHLYTRQNPETAQILVLEDNQSVTNSNFDPNKVTVIFVHGWNSSPTGSTATTIREGFLGDEDVNLIHLDWSKLANRNYITAKNGVMKVGRGLAAFLMWLTTQGLQYEKLHLVGYSLGAHLVGSAGRSVGGRAQRITALDPAGPLWLLDSNRLSKNDARYVEVIHTNTDLFGYTNPLGHADFYPNGGDSMPGCLINTCSHRRAPQYFASTVKYNHLSANECSSMRQMERNMCRGTEYPMGNNDINKFREGIFRVNTRRNYPF